MTTKPTTDESLLKAVATEMLNVLKEQKVLTDNDHAPDTDSWIAYAKGFTGLNLLAQAAIEAYEANQPARIESVVVKSDCIHCGGKFIISQSPPKQEANDEV